MQRLSKERFLALIYEGMLGPNLDQKDVKRVRSFLKRYKFLSVEQMINKLCGNKKCDTTYRNLLCILGIYDGECIDNCWCNNGYDEYCYEWLCGRFKYNDVRSRCIEILNSR